MALNRNLRGTFYCKQMQHKVYTCCKVSFIQEIETDNITDIMCLLRLCALTVSMETLLPFFPLCFLHNKVNSTHGECLSDYLSVSFWALTRWTV